MGFFADPIYGGNRDMCAWKMIGFPGARYDYRDWVGRHNERYPHPPVSIGGRGLNLVMPVPVGPTALLRQDPKVTAQLQRTDATDCWGAATRTTARIRSSATWSSKAST